MPEKLITKREFAALCGVHRTRVHHWILEGKLKAPALVGVGRQQMVVPSIGQRQVALARDSGQAMGNGLKARLRPLSPGPAPPEPGVDDAHPLDELDEQIKREKLETLQRANRIAADNEAAAQGRYTSTAAVKRQMTMLVGQSLRIFEGAIPQIASALAAELKIEERDVIPLLHAEFRKVREQAAKHHKKLAEQTPGLVADRADAPEA